MNFKKLNGVYVYNKSLKADVKLNLTGLNKIRRFNGLDESAVKLQSVAKLKHIVASAVVYDNSDSYDEKEKRAGMKYHYMQTPILVSDKDYWAKVVVRGDNNGKFYYDLQIKDEMPSIIKDNKKATKRTNPLTLGGVIGSFDDNDNQTDSLSQEFFADDDVMLDSTGSKMVLNLFIFDENGNEIDDLVQDEPQPVENPQNNDIDDNQGTGEPKNNTDKLKGEPKYEYRPHGKDLTFVGQEFDHTPTGDAYTVWGVAKGQERWGVAIAVETVNMGKKITTQELAQKVADVMAQRFGYTQLEIRSDRAFLGGGVSAISNAFGAGGLTKPAQENNNQDTQAELTKQMNEPTEPKNNTDEQDPNLAYLTDMANGKIELTVQNMQEHIGKLKQIAVALDGKHDDLLNQAIEVYQQFALSVKVQ